jgi:hypothetical protein
MQKLLPKALFHLEAEALEFSSQWHELLLAEEGLNSKYHLHLDETLRIVGCLL